MTAATPIYRAIMLEIERRRVALGLPMAQFCEFAGLPDRYYSKALHADEPSGRRAQWSTLQIIVQALFRNGFDLEIRARPGPAISEESLKAKLLQLKATVDPKSQRQLMRELGMRGAARPGLKIKRRKLRKWRRRAIAKRAAKIRWEKAKNTELVGISEPQSVDA